MRYSDAQVARLLYDQGWRQPDLETAVRIVLGESGGNPAAVGVNANGTVDRGLFQINSGAWPRVTAATALDVQGNIRAAWQIYRQQRGFRPHHSAWWGGSNFHSLRKVAGRYVPATNLVRRAQIAARSIQPAPTFAGGSAWIMPCLLYTSPSPRDGLLSRMPSSA